MTRPTPTPRTDPPTASAAAPPSPPPHRLLAGWHETGQPADYPAHHARHGPLPQGAYRGRAGRERLIATVTEAGLRGHGGGRFPTGAKLAAVAGNTRRDEPGVVVLNACEADPESEKDHALCTVAPHLVLDGAVLAAHATGVTRVIACAHQGDPLAIVLARAAAARPAGEPPIRVIEMPRRYVASEETALVNYLNSGDPRPTAKPPRPFQRGVAGRPTLLCNAETLAHLALIARHGPDWYRALGAPEEPGTTLVTISGAVTRPGVYETPLGVPLREILRTAGAPTEPVQAVLVGGYAGGWLPLPGAAGLPLTHADLAAAGAALGVAALVVLPTHACGLTETTRILAYLADASAHQCGPCMFGLPAITSDLETIVTGARHAPHALTRLQRRLAIVPGRGACSHPDGTTRLARSALTVFATDLAEHLDGPCPTAGHPWLAQPARPRPGGRQ